MCKEDIIYYKESIELFKREVELCNIEIEWLEQKIKREEYNWGPSAKCDIYIIRRNKVYGQLKIYKEIIEKYEELLAEY